ncbi:hypothetical protein O7627_24250 [Solwaraspora sp. WMMD1047]|uniref:hypothetical protein n=1 Tax=Solwaraspora sp. WMMD1047 TaxID=3016102 RepID=UPI0024178C9E|nr:hypothetical protein [Solwaraspora sp. WMMD1047]MDG4832395.1 hypothetical protein [Solwaraspora sp. WMMD1047]
MDNVRYLPGASVVLAPGRPRADRDAIGDRYTALCEARAHAATSVIAMLAEACADDVPVLVDELHQAEQLRRELATAVDELADTIAAVRALHEEREVAGPAGPVLVCAGCGIEVGAGPCPTIAALDGGSDG